ncbi:hypothetical protein CANCADRAFT_80663 [Tortispora caseinolytica NRRL Y-17796]|uniref:Uncharacterized protein n=1 Tax=Tortispora caseinolytica NRRL Y-17796 TaxID=767744 RepID=A0A1E4TJP0_9ASCO|nr:hypothetical protein CANCADRAFT_80663 [Tortispora caseinolytica NRRL Y-17796]
MLLQYKGLYRLLKDHPKSRRQRRVLLESYLCDIEENMTVNPELLLASKEVAKWYTDPALNLLLRPEEALLGDLIKLFLVGKLAKRPEWKYENKSNFLVVTDSHLENVIKSLIDDRLKYQCNELNMLNKRPGIIDLHLLYKTVHNLPECKTLRYRSFVKITRNVIQKHYPNSGRLASDAYILPLESKT